MKLLPRMVRASNLIVMGVVGFLTWSCGNSNFPQADSSSVKVIGGHEVSREGHYQSVLLVGPSGCTGTLIRNDLVLTASHCTKKSMHVVLPSGEKVKAVEVLQPPKAGPGNGKLDLAVLKLERELTDVEGVAVVPVDLAGVEVGDELEIAGFGCTKPDGSGYGKLRAGVSLVEGSANGGREFTMKGKGVQNCYGDSGGPVFSLVAGGGVMVSGGALGATVRGVVSKRSTSGLISYQVNLAHPDAKKWLESLL